MDNKNTTTKPNSTTNIATTAVSFDSRLRRNFRLWNTTCLILNLITCISVLIGLALRNGFQDYSGVIIMVTSTFSGLIAAPITLHYLMRLKTANLIMPITNLLTMCNIVFAVIISNISIVLSVIICVLVGINSKSVASTEPPSARLQSNNSSLASNSKIQKQTFNKTVVFIAVSIFMSVITGIIGANIINQITPETSGAASMAIGLGFAPITGLPTSIDLIFIIINSLNLSSLRKNYGIRPTMVHKTLNCILVISSFIPLTILLVTANIALNMH